MPHSICAFCKMEIYIQASLVYSYENMFIYINLNLNKANQISSDLQLQASSQIHNIVGNRDWLWDSDNGYTSNKHISLHT